MLVGVDDVARRRDTAAKLFTISDVAELFGVSLPTLRRRDDAGKFKAGRHPISGYRLYKHAEVLKLRKSIERGGVSGSL